jgi:beta-galactosidase
MKKIPLLLLLSMFITGAAFSQENDHIFPAAASAKKNIDFDRQGFIINGKKTFLVSAGMEYARIPHQLWRDRLMRLKRDGFNCIEIYTFWNFHEPHEGQFDFLGDHDLDAFLKLVKQLGMYATVRVGPYYCAEWDFGGYPIWLHFKNNLVAREPNAEFEKYADRFFDKLIPIVSKNQINHGGAVVLVQLENEHDDGWGTLVPNEYFSHLQKKALSLGLQVPYFFSGLHHGGDPAGNGTKAFDDISRPNPWFTTEFWAVWYNYYGSSQKDADEFGRRTWKIIAHGGGGYNYYMAHGGTNFGYTNSDEDAASYDYGAAVGQTGDLRPIYYQFKRNALFARSFESILCNAADASSSYKKLTNDTLVRVYARHSDKGDIAFLDNHGKTAETLQINAGNHQLPAEGGITLAPGEIMPVVKNFKLSPEVTMDWAVTRILGISTEGNTHTLVVYGPSGSKGELQFSSVNAIHIVAGNQGFTTASKNTDLKITFNDVQPTIYTFKSGAATVRVIAVNTNLADYTWFTETNNKQYIVTGPEYLDSISVKNNRLQLVTEHFWARDKQSQVWVYSENGVKTLNVGKADIPHPQELHLEKWKASSASAAASTGFDDSKWLKGNAAPQMGADNDLSSYAWYRTGFKVNEAGDYIFRVRNGGDRATLYIDNIRVAAGKIPGSITLPQLKPGNHTLAVFTAHDGRNKLYNYYGPLEYKDSKGLSGNLVLQKDKPAFLTDWKIMNAADGTVTNNIPSFDQALPYKLGDDAFDKKKGYRWFQAVIPVSNEIIPKSLYVRELPAKSVIFINGKQITLPEDGAPGHFVLLTDLINPSQQNTLTIFIENKHDGHKQSLDNPAEVIINHKNDIVLSDWHMKGGPGNLLAINDWKPLAANNSFDRPEFYSNTFNVLPAGQAHVIWRVTFDGLGHGSIWVNGYNLGRYPEKIPVKSLYIPECWLQKGANHIIIFDEDGNKPDKVSIQAEQASSRDIHVLTL